MWMWMRMWQWQCQQLWMCLWVCCPAGVTAQHETNWWWGKASFSSLRFGIGLRPNKSLVILRAMSKYVGLKGSSTSYSMNTLLHTHSPTHTLAHTACICLAGLLGWLKNASLCWLNVFLGIFLLFLRSCVGARNPKTANFQKQTSYFANWAESTYPAPIHTHTQHSTLLLGP